MDQTKSKNKDISRPFKECCYDANYGSALRLSITIVFKVSIKDYEEFAGNITVAASKSIYTTTTIGVVITGSETTA